MGLLDIFKADKKKKEVKEDSLEKPELSHAPLPPAPSPEGTETPPVDSPPETGSLPPIPQEDDKMQQSANLIENIAQKEETANPLEQPPGFAPQDASLDLPPPPPMELRAKAAPEDGGPVEQVAEPPLSDTGSSNIDALSAALDTLGLDSQPGNNLPPPVEEAAEQPDVELPPKLEGEQPPQPDIEPPEQMPVPEPEKVELPPVPEIPKEWGEESKKPVAEIEQLAEEPDEPPAKEEEIEQLVEGSDIPQSVPDIESFGEMPSIGKKEEDLNKELQRFDTPHFVKVEDFGEIAINVNQLNGMLKESDRIFSRMKEIKSLKERKLQEWQKSIEDVQRKLVYLDNKLFEVA